MRKRMSISIAMLIVLFIGFAAGIFLDQVMLHKHFNAAHSGIGITPTLYMPGSSGNMESIMPIVNAVTADKATGAKKGLEIQVAANDTLTVKGRITKNNTEPTIAIGLDKGTNSSVKISAAIKAVTSYLKDNYNVLSYNLLGFSAGGGGDLRYLIDQGRNPADPFVRRWISLDGQYNACTPLQPGETMKDIYKNGPTKQTKYYKFWKDNISKMSPNVQCALLAADHVGQKETDGTVPWADTFSIVSLLQKNGNPITHYTYGGNATDTKHINVPTNPAVWAFVENYFY